MKFLVFGSLNIDHVYHLDHFVREGETLSSFHYEKNAGGKGFNQALALSKAGQHVCMAGAIGEDGLFLQELLKDAAVDTEHLKVVDAPTGHAMIQVDRQGRNGIVICGGANSGITQQQIDEVLSHFDAGDYVLMQNEISHGDYVLSRASELGLHVIVNPSPISDELLTWPIEKADWLILNEIEGHDLTGKTDRNEIVDELLKRYPQMKIVLTLGVEGSLYADAQRRIYQLSIPVTALDTTGAGDTFTGYFFATYLQTQHVAEALCIAAHASSIAVSRAGAGEAIPWQEEVLAVLPERWNEAI